MATAQLALPRPLVQQQPVLEAPHRFKACHAGRRGAKSRLGMTAALAGHGPRTNHLPLWRGAAQGATIGWLSPDYPQSAAIWREEFKARCEGVVGITLHESDRRLEIVNGGSIRLRSAESIDSLRGSKLDGVVIDEAAWLDLEYAWNDVIRPALADAAGWALFLGTPNAGADGNTLKQTPSYFNRLCREIYLGSRGPEWGIWRWSTRDNPVIAPEEIEALYASYPPNSPIAAQELDGELLEGALGLVFREWSPTLHVLPETWEIPRGWTFGGGMDWGYRAPGWFGLFAGGPDGDLVCVDEISFREQTGYQVGYAIGTKCRAYPTPDYIAADEQMWYETGLSAPNIAEEVQSGIVAAYGGRIDLAPKLIAASHGRGSRAAKLVVTHRYLAWTAGPDGKPLPWQLPKLRFRAQCRAAIRTIPVLPYDPHKPEDVDTHADDHPYDGVAAYLMSRPRLGERPLPPVEQDKHPGYVGRTRRRPYQEMIRRAQQSVESPGWVARDQDLRPVEEQDL